MIEITLLNELKNDESYIIELRHRLHRIAEVAHKEFKTTALIKEELGKLDVEIRDIGLETGVCALLIGAQDGPTIALRADIDALPLQEDTGLPFSSEHDGVSHSCGHDIHTAVLLGTARYLSRHRDLIAGNVWFYFQPAEETLTGAKMLVNAGCLKQDPVPESLLTIHTSPAVETGKFGIISGPSNSSCDNFRITINSIGGHGATPHLCGDPIVAASSLVMQLQTCVSRDTNPMMPAVLTVGSFHGGTVPNIIPATVVMEGTIRTYSAESRSTILNSLERITNNVCAAFRTEAKIEMLESCTPAVINDPRIIEKAEASIVKLFGADAIFRHPFPAPGSEDFAVYIQDRPGAQIRMGTRDPKNPATAIGLHSPNTQFDENSFYYTAAMLCQYVLDYLPAEK